MKPTKSTFFLGCLVGGMGAALVPVLLTHSQADTKLLPFQGRLTDAAGGAVPDGAKVVEFKMYDAPTGGSVKWAGEVHKLSVNGGLVNTMLGSKASLGSVDFGSPTYLQITIDANGDDQISAADPPLLPRQSVVSAVYAVEAGNARGLQWTDAHGVAQGSGNWSALFGPGRDPATATLDGGRVTPNTLPVNRLILGSGLTSAHLADNSVTSSELANNSVDSPAIIDREVKSVDIGIGEVKTANLGDGSVTSDIIENGTIGTVDLANASVTSEKLNLELAYFREKQSIAQTGGTPANPAQYQKRTLNEDVHGAVLPHPHIRLDPATSRITLDAGVYLVEGSCPAYQGNRHMAKVVDYPYSEDLILGTSEYNISGTGNAATRSHFRGAVVVEGAARTIEIWHYVASGNAGSTGLGVHMFYPGTDASIYSEVLVIKIR